MATVGGVCQFCPLVRVRPDLYAHRQENRRLLLPIERWPPVLSAGEDVYRRFLLQGDGLVSSRRVQRHIYAKFYACPNPHNRVQSCDA